MVNPEAKEEVSATAEVKEREKGCILLAEDNELNREIATEILQEAGFLVEAAENGQIAVEMLQ